MAATPGAECRCPPAAVRRYADKISGPVRDRVDIVQAFLPLRRSQLKADADGEPSSRVAARVVEARDRQRRRLLGTPWRTNGEVPGPYLRRGMPPPHGAQLAWDALDRGRLSARGVDKVFRLAWSVADLAGRDRPSRDDTALALAMRRGEQPGTLAREAG